MFRTTIDLPEEIHKALKVKAATEGTTLNSLIKKGIENILKLENAAISYSEALHPEDPVGEAAKAAEINNPIDFYLWVMYNRIMNFGCSHLRRGFDRCPYF